MYVSYGKVDRNNKDLFHFIFLRVQTEISHRSLSPHLVQPL